MAEVELAVIKEQIHTVKTDIDELKDSLVEIKSGMSDITKAVVKLSSIEDKLTSERESRKLLWDKLDSIRDRLHCMEPEISWIRDHRKTYEDHCKVLDWCTAHRVEYETIKSSILKNMLLAAFTASSIVGGLVYVFMKELR